MSNSIEKVIGIDLGTEYCCVATFENKSLKIIPNKRKNLTTPSYVSFTANGLHPPPKNKHT
jgi:L1 cell adhesion molecule like protein